MKRKAWIVIGVLVGLGLFVELLEQTEVTVVGELSEEQKKELFKLMVSAEADAREKAEERLPEASTADALLEQAEWEDALRERSWSALATEYGVTTDDLLGLAQSSAPVC